MYLFLPPHIHSTPWCFDQNVVPPTPCMYMQTGVAGQLVAVFLGSGCPNHLDSPNLKAMNMHATIKPQNGWKQKQKFCFSKMCQKQTYHRNRNGNSFQKGGGWQFEKIFEQIWFPYVSVSKS